MQFKLSLAVCDGTVESDAQTLLTLELDSQPSIETLGLSLTNGKVALAQLQAQIVTRQVELMSASQRRCESCGRNRAIKDYHDIHYSSLFGRVVVRVPRWQRCACSVRAEIAHRRARRWISAELEYVQSHLAATIPYARSSELLGLLLPVAGANAPSTVREHTLGVGRRLDAQGLEAQPEVAGMESKSNVTTIGLDGGYLRLCHLGVEKSFEVVAGRAMRAGVGQRSVAFVRTVDEHSNERVRSVLAERALRCVAIGRKNYLHVGSDAGGHAAAVIYTLLGMAKLNGINPQRYLHYVLERIADHSSDRIDELLPWVVAAKLGDTAPTRKTCRWPPERQRWRAWAK